MNRPFGLMIVLAIWCSPVDAQLQNNQWRFGFNSAIDFNTNPPGFPTGTALPTIQPPLITGDQIEGSASIANRNTGELLFYTDGVTIWNALDQPMPNGSDLGGSDVLSAFMAAVIIAVPGSCTKYYVFCIDDYEEGCTGVTYSVVDMSLDNGLGDVVAGQKSVPLYDNETELLLAYPNSSGDGYWVLTNGEDPFTPTIAAFEVTEAGVNPDPVLSPVTMGGSGRLNYQGTRFVCTGQYDSDSGSFLGFDLFDFNAETGQLSNPVSIPFFSPNDVLQYFEFTFDGDYLYAGAVYNIYQFDLSSGDPATILASATLTPIGNQFEANGTIQMGPDGNLYSVLANSVLRIENPDNPAALIGPITELPETVFASIGLPQWIHLLDEEVPEGVVVKTGDSCVFSEQEFTFSESESVESIQWNFGDPDSGAENTSTDLTPAHTFSQPGTYTITAIVIFPCGADTVQLAVDIVACDLPCEASIILSGDSCLESPVLFSLEAEVAISAAVWNFGDLNSGPDNTSTLLNPAHLFSEAGVYEVGVVVSLACGVDTLSASFNVVSCEDIADDCDIFLPNTFSPNFDGLNDAFFPVTECPLEDYDFAIFNRWGQQVFRSSDSERKWFGQCSNTMCSDGVYYYVFTCTLPSQFVRRISGHVILLR
ncbi:MAG: PKD domain-containing protein [Flavobacteriales bacterium]